MLHVDYNPYITFKLSCVVNFVNACLSMASPIDNTYVPVKLLPSYANLKTATLTFKSSFKDTQFTEHTAAASSSVAASQSTPGSSVVEGLIHNISQAPGVSERPTSRPVNKRKRFSRKDPSGKSDGTTTGGMKRGEKYVCDKCGW